MYMKKLLSIFVATVIVLSIFSVIALPASAEAVTSGTTGECTWTLDGTVLTISGNGEMDGCDSSCKSLITEVIIEQGVTGIGYWAFYDCRSLTSITIPDSVTYIGDAAFYDCRSLTSITIPKSVTNINDRVFGGCSSLTSITISDGVTYIGEGAFHSCSSLTSITIPDSVTSIGNLAFYNCSSLTSITIPDSVTSIGWDAFSDCSSLTRIVFKGDAPDRFEEPFYSVTATVYYPAGNETWTEDVMQDYGGTITWVPYEVAVKEWNVSLEDDLKINFYLDGEIAETSDVTVTVGDGVKTCSLSGLEKDENGRYIVSVNVAAAQMNDSIIVQVDDMEPESYTVRQYCDTILADESFSQYHQLVKEMLNYGAMAQLCFDYNTENLANDGINDAAAEDVPNSTTEMFVSGTVDSIDFYGASLVYRNNIAVRFYYTVAGDVSNYTFTVNDQVYTPVLKNGTYYIEVADILPQNLEQQITVTVQDNSENKMTVTYGPMNYIVRMSQKGSEQTKALVKALYNYHLAAKALCAETA